MKEQMNEYLDNVKKFLALDIENADLLIESIRKTEPENRMTYDAEKKEFVLGMARWPVEKVQNALKDIRKAVIAVFDSAVADQGKISKEALVQLNNTSYDLKIQHIPSEDSPSGMKLGYVVPDSKIAWEEGKCPHCGETVTIHIFPDLIPILAYEAIINTLRLVTRQIKIGKNADGTYFLKD